MDGLDIVLVFAIILFARLGIRLVRKLTRKTDDDQNEKD